MALSPNAVGVAIAPVSGRWDTVIASGQDRGKAIDEASDIATSRAIQAGADPSRVEIVEISEIPIGYLPEPATRLRVRAAGPIGLGVLADADGESSGPMQTLIEATVIELRYEADSVVSVGLATTDHSPLPHWTAGRPH